MPAPYSHGSDIERLSHQKLGEKADGQKSKTSEGLFYFFLQPLPRVIRERQRKSERIKINPA